MTQPASQRARIARSPYAVRFRPPLVLGLAAVLTACSGDTPGTDEQPSYTLTPKEPWTSDRHSSTRLVLERIDGGFKVVSSAPSFGGVTRPNVVEAVPDILEGKQRLYEYAALNSAGDVLTRGYFTVSLKARAAYTEADDPQRVRHAEFDDPSRFVRVAIPYLPEIASVEFQALVPNKDRNYESWQRESAGSIRLETAPTQQQQGQAPS